MKKFIGAFKKTPGFDLGYVINKNWRILLILLASLAITWPLFVNGFFSHHDDLQIMRIYEMRKCFADLQIPCRWVPDLGNGYGFPMFNYYGVFPYYIGGILSYLTSYIISAKILFLLPLFLGGFFVYLLTRELFGKDVGFLAGILYVFTPYRAVDAYVRGAVTELFAISAMPLVLFFYLKLIKKLTINNFLGATLSLGIFFLNHNIITMLFMPIFILWLIIRFFIDGRKNIKGVFASLLIGFGLAIFFLAPAYFETNLIQAENLKQSIFIPSFEAHFVTIRQLFLDRSWGYGISTWLEADTLSFQAGWPHWWLAAGSFVLLSINILRGIFKKKYQFKKDLPRLLNIGFIFLILIVSLFMTHNKSTFIWKYVEILQYAQFPWRFLGISILAVSIMGGFFLSFFSKKIRPLLLLTFCVITIVLNFKYFKPEIFYRDRKDEDYFSGSLREYQYQGAIYDYLPKTAVLPTKAAPDMPMVLSGEAKITSYCKQSKSWRFNVDSTENSDISVPVFDFPNWTVYINSKEVAHSEEKETGSILVKVGKGKHEVVGYFKNTRIRFVSNALSFISLIILLFIILKYRKLK